MRLIQITDCHLHADPDARCRTGIAYRQLEVVVAAASRLYPNLVLVTGDISEDESPESYALAEQALSRFDCPWHWLAGNHDVPATLAACRPQPEAIDAGRWRLLLVDTYWEGHDGGQLTDATLAALGEALAQHPERPTLLIMHHPPVAVGSAWLDEIGLRDADALAALLCGQSQVRGILCGHIHQAFAGHLETESGEVPVYGCPSTSDQFLRGSDDFAVDEASRPGFRVVDLGNGDLSTWVERVDL
jgi:Icc protein